MSYITRVLSIMSRFGMRSLNRLFSHFFWFNLNAFRLASPPEGMRACAYLPKGSLVYRTKSSLHILQYSRTPELLYCWLVQGRLLQHEYRHTNSTHRPTVNVA